MTLLLHLSDFNERRWADGFAAALPGRKVVTRADSYDPDEIEYIFIWKPKRTRSRACTSSRRSCRWGPASTHCCATRRGPRTCRLHGSWTRT